MELKPGYKQTEVGVIPEDWDAVPLGKLYKFSNGVNADKAAYGKGLRFINVLEPITYSHIRGPEITGLVELTSQVASAYTVNHGDIVFNRTSETDTELGMAAAYLGHEKVVFGGFVIRGQAISDDLDPTYAGYALRGEMVRDQIIPLGQGAVRANIGQESLRKVRVLVPPEHEQKLIAEALQDIDSLLTNIQESLYKKRQIKQAAMQELLTGKRRLPGFEGEWEQVSLGSVAAMNSGGTPPTGRDDFYGGGIPWVSISDMTSSGRFISETERTLSDLGLANCAAKRFPAGTIMYAMYASLGECSMAAREVTTSQAILGIRPGPSLVGEYLYYWLDSIRGAVKLMGQQGTQSNLNKKIVQGFSLKLPSKTEQAAIAKVLGEIDQDIDALKVKAEKTRAMKAGMMQRLLTGKIRLI
jgi:type I restriction enzyme S subunit